MSAIDPDEQARRFAADALAHDDATGWFERLYSAADRGEAEIPWDRGAPQPALVEWARAQGLRGTGRRALVVGAGLGDDAEFVSGLGFETTAFDVSASAIAAARRRFPDSAVRYRTADLLEPPSAWLLGFDLVWESFTVQALPDAPRPTAIVNVGRFVAHGGTLIVYASGREASAGPAHGPPWPLMREEVDAFASGGLEPVLVERLGDAPMLRWRAEFRRP